jgi:hypothetical protein
MVLISLSRPIPEEILEVRRENVFIKEKGA